VKRWIIICLLIFISVQSLNKYIYNYLSLTINQLNKVEKFSYDNLKEALNKLEVQSPDIILRQAKLESGNFQSKIFKENNNFMGMMQPRVRETTAIGKNRGHAVYENWYECVKDIVLFQKYYQNRIKNSANYYDFLSQIYASDPNYIYKLKQIKI